MKNPNENKENKVGTAVAWSFAAEMSAKLIVPLVNMVLARVLAPEAFGIIATINMVVSFADTLSSTGISKYVIQHKFSSNNDLYRSADVAFWTNIIIASLMWCAIVVFRAQISAAVGNTGCETALVVAALSLPLSAISSIQEAVFQRNLEYKVLFYRRIAVAFLPLFITVPLALFGLGHWALITGTLTGNILKVVILTVSSKWKPSLYYSVKRLKEMISFCIWMLLSAILAWSITYIDVLLVSNRFGEYYTGLYKNSQMMVVGVISIITGATTSVLFSALSKEQDDLSRFKALLFRFQERVGIIVIPLGVGMFCFCDLLTWVLLGSQWMEASRFVGVWGLSTAVTCVFADYCKEACKAKGKPNLTFWEQLVHLVFLVPVCYLGVQKGFLALGYLRSVINLERIAAYFVILSVSINISPSMMVKNLLAPVLSSIVMGCLGLVLLFIDKGNYTIQMLYVIICAISYFACLCLSRKYRSIILDFCKSMPAAFAHRFKRKRD